jgi:DNA-binding transcriptional MerR regulator/uncharacterized glyoxalase superfamily protein PhnB
MAGSNEPYWRVGALSAATGLSVRTFHHYNEIGLLEPSCRSAGGHRLYTRDDVARLAMIVILRRAGLPLAEIRSRLAEGPVDVDALITKRAADLEAALIDTTAFGRRLREGSVGQLVGDPALVRELVDWIPRSPITTQPLVLLVYADVERAYGRLIELFGFGPGGLSRNTDGSVGYAEITGPTGNIRLHGPRPGLAPPDPEREPSSMTVVGVDDIDAHYRRARRAGARIDRRLRSMFGMREYLALDHEHHLWCFQQPTAG